MTRPKRCAWILFLIFPALIWQFRVWSQSVDDPAGDSETVPAPTGIIPSLRADPPLARKLDAARDYVDKKAWVEATHALQGLLDRREDALVSVKRTSRAGDETLAWTGLHAEAARLLASLPTDGHAYYEATYGPRARTQLTEAYLNGDMHAVADVARRYARTRAGLEAIGMLGAYHLDRGRPLLAGLWFARLIERPDASLSPAALACAALAFHRSGDTLRVEQTWRRLSATAPGGWRVGDKLINLDDLRKEWDRDNAPRAAVRAPEIATVLKLGWTSPTVHEAMTRGWLSSAFRQQDANGLPVLPESFPVLVGDRLVYRSHRGVHAVDVRSGKELWDKPLGWSLDKMATEGRHSAYLESWVDCFNEGGSSQIVFSNGVVGTLSTDGARVYSVDDLEVPPVKVFRGGGRRWQDPAWPDFGAELTDAAFHNRLSAYDPQSGEKLWQIGGRGMDEEVDDLTDTYFLGPPLAVDGRLYVTTEQSNKLSLACLRAETGELLWKQPLAIAPTGLLYDPGRRIQPARPTLAGGMLICPTNSGVVIGIDLATRDLSWAYPYRSEALTQSPLLMFGRRGGRSAPPRIVAEWKAPSAIVRQDRVVLTTPDEASIHCLNLRDGSLLWKVPRGEDDLYVAAVLSDRVFVVGKQSCRALALEDGKELWQIATGIPSGIGLLSGDLYHLPLKEAAEEKVPGVWVIDVRKGVIRTRLGPTDRPAAGSASLIAAEFVHSSAFARNPPGNLLLWKGSMISQNAAAISTYWAK